MSKAAQAHNLTLPIAQVPVSITAAAGLVGANVAPGDRVKLARTHFLAFDGDVFARVRKVKADVAGQAVTLDITDPLTNKPLVVTLGQIVLVEAAAAVSKYDNMSDAMVADEYGHAKAALDAAQAEVDALKEEIKRRKLTSVSGAAFELTVTEQIQARPDVPALKAYLGSAYSRFEKPSVSKVIRVKAVVHKRSQLAA